MAASAQDVSDARAVLAAIDEEIHASRRDARATGLVLIEIERLHELRMGYGLAAVEAALHEAERRIRGLARARDRVLRIGDAQFVLLVPGLMNPDLTELAARKVLRELDLCHAGTRDAVRLSPRLGLAVDEGGTGCAQALLQRAQRALSHAAGQGEPLARCHGSGQHDAETELHLEAAIDRGLHQGEFELWCQPKLDLQTRLPVGAEGLSRWRNPQLGLVAPDVFVPIAERTGRMARLTWAALNMGLQQLAEWPDTCPGAGIAINASATCLYQPDFVRQVLDALSIWNIPPGRLTIEVTETVAMQDTGLGDRVLRALRDAGVRVSIDDFGSGYSSLAYFKSLPADEVKIDRSFIRELTRDAADRHIVTTVIDLARRFGLDVVAEGIEDEATLECLAEMGCDTAQGYLIGRPMPHALFIEYLRGVPPGSA